MSSQDPGKGGGIMGERESQERETKRKEGKLIVTGREER